MLDRNWKLLHVTLAGHHLVAGDFDDMVRTFKSRLADAQRRGKMRTGMYVEIRETACSVHSHFIVAGTPAALRAIRRLPDLFGADVDGNAFLAVTRVYDVEGLIAYLSKEASGWACQVTGRRYQRHTSAAIGDRVRLGRGLEAMMAGAGELEPYRKTYNTATAGRKNRNHSSDDVISASIIAEAGSHG